MLFCCRLIDKYMFIKLLSYFNQKKNVIDDNHGEKFFVNKINTCDILFV